jgi:hypothetical protein
MDAAADVAPREAGDAGPSDAGDGAIREASGLDGGDGAPEAGDATASEGGSVDSATPDAATDSDAATGGDETGVSGDSGDGGGDGGTDGTGGGACPGCTFTTIAVDATNLVYDAAHARVYVTQSAQAMTNPNTLGVIDLPSATVIANLPIGTDPNPLAISDDDTALWVGLTGDNAIRKVTLGTGAPTVGPLQPVPPQVIGVSSLPTHVIEMAVFPGSPATLAASVVSEVGRTWISVFDDGVARPMTGSLPLDAVSRIALGPPGYVFGYDSIDSGFTLTVYSVGPTGATFLSSTSGLITGFEGFLVYDSNRLFSFFGEVVDVSVPAQPVLAGQFAYRGAVAVRDASHVFMLAPTAFASTFASPNMLQLLDSTTFTQVAAVPLPADVIPATNVFPNFVYVGGDTLVFLAVGDNNTHVVCLAHVPPLFSTP